MIFKLRVPTVDIEIKQSGLLISNTKLSAQDGYRRYPDVNQLIVKNEYLVINQSHNAFSIRLIDTVDNEYLDID